MSTVVPTYRPASLARLRSSADMRAYPSGVESHLGSRTQVMPYYASGVTPNLGSQMQAIGPPQPQAPSHPILQRTSSGPGQHQSGIARHFDEQPGRLGKHGSKGTIGNAQPKQRQFFPCGRHNPLTMRCKLATKYRGTFNEQTHREHIVSVHAADARFRLDISHGPGYVKQLRISAETSDQ